MAKGRKTGGRIAGTRNKATAEIKAAIRLHRDALVEAAGARQKRRRAPPTSRPPPSAQADQKSRRTAAAVKPASFLTTLFSSTQVAPTWRVQEALTCLPAPKCRSRGTARSCAPGRISSCLMVNKTSGFVNIIVSFR